LDGTTPQKRETSRKKKVQVNTADGMSALSEKVNLEKIIITGVSLTPRGETKTGSLSKTAVAWPPNRTPDIYPISMGLGETKKSTEKEGPGPGGGPLNHGTWGGPADWQKGQGKKKKQKKENRRSLHGYKPHGRFSGGQRIKSNRKISVERVVWGGRPPNEKPPWRRPALGAGPEKEQVKGWRRNKPGSGR